MALNFDLRDKVVDSFMKKTDRNLAKIYKKFQRKTTTLFSFNMSKLLCTSIYGTSKYETTSIWPNTQTETDNLHILDLSTKQYPNNMFLKSRFDLSLFSFKVSQWHWTSPTGCLNALDSDLDSSELTEPKSEIILAIGSHLGSASARTRKCARASSFKTCVSKTEN